MNKKFLVNSSYFNKWGSYMPGSKSNKCTPKVKTEDPAVEDRKNRNQVVREIEEQVDRGISIENACKNLVETYKDKFKYLPEENLAQIFAGWYNGRHRDSKSIEERTC